MKVIDFKNPELHKAFEIRGRKPCTHRSVIIDVEKRVVECSVCGTVLDAFEFLLHTASEEGMWYTHATNLKAEVNRLATIRERLKAQISSLKSQYKKRTGEELTIKP